MVVWHARATDGRGRGWGNGDTMCNMRKAFFTPIESRDSVLIAAIFEAEKIDPLIMDTYVMSSSREKTPLKG